MNRASRRPSRTAAWPTQPARRRTRRPGEGSALRLARRVPAQVEVNGTGRRRDDWTDRRGRPGTGRRWACPSTRSHAGGCTARCSTRCAISTGRRARCARCAATSTRRSTGCATSLCGSPRAPRSPPRSTSEAEYDKMLVQISAVDICMMRQLDADTSDSPMMEVAIDPGEGQQVLLERAELKLHLVRAISSCPNASARFSRSTTTTSSRSPKSARSSASASPGCRSCARRPSRACAASARRCRTGCDEQDSFAGRD